MPGTCPVCGGPVAARPRGRPSVYCSRACQAKAYRARRAEGDGARLGERQAARLAAFHAALAIETALADGWETLDRYGADRPHVVAALNDLRAELERRAAAAQPRRLAPVRDESLDSVTEIAPLEVAEDRPPLIAVPETAPCEENQLGRDENGRVAVQAAEPGFERALRPVPGTGAPEPAGPGDDDVGGLDPAREIHLARLYEQTHLLLVDGRRVGWLEETSDGTAVHDAGGRIVTTLDAGHHRGIEVAVRAAAALGIAGAERAAVALGGALRDHRDRIIETDPRSLAAWTLLKGRVPGREDVIVRGRCIGWLQRHQGGYAACTLDGPVPGSSSPTRADAVLALFAAMYAPAPLPDLGPDARAARRPRARSRREKPICPYTSAQLAAAALPDHLTRLPDGSYRVHINDGIDDVELGRVYRTRGPGRRWQAIAPGDRIAPGGRTVVHRATTRTEAIDNLLATPGPLFGDPAEVVIHDLTDTTFGDRDDETPEAAPTGASGPVTATAAAEDLATKPAPTDAGAEAAEVDQDALFDAIEDVVYELDATGAGHLLPAEVAEAVTAPVDELANVLARASGNGPLDALLAAAGALLTAAAPVLGHEGIPVRARAALTALQAATPSANYPR